MKTEFNIKIFSLIILSAIILAFIYNQFSNDGISLIREPLLVEFVDSTSAELSNNSIKGLTLAQVIQLQSQNIAVFIDARDQWDYSDAHIKGAINIPEFSFESNNKELSTIDKEKIIVIYCDGDDCDTSKRLAKQIIAMGYKNTFVFLGGISEWKDAELPIVEGKIND